MHINKLIIQSFRGITDCEIDFNGRSTIIFGYNGAGKTSILSAINLLYSNIINAIVKNRFKQGIQIDSKDVKIGKSKCALTMSFKAFEYDYNYSRFYDKSANKRTHTIKDLKEFLENFNSLYDDNYDTDCNVPVYANYGVHRLVLDVPLRIRKHHNFDTLSTYEKAIESKIDFRTFFEWFRNREDYENEIKVTENSQYTDVQLFSVKKAIFSFLDDVTDIRVHRNPLAMIITKNNNKLNIEQLSDGEKCVLALIGDLARRLSIANPKLNNPLLGKGIVLIDEIELHLHPTWQRKIIPALRKTFPNIQFIVTTHSPQVLNEVDDNMKVFVATKNTSDNNIDLSELNPMNGWDINDILGNFMDTAEINADTKKLIDEIYENIDDEEYETAQEKISKLEQMTNNNNKTVIELKFLLKKRMRKR